MAKQALKKKVATQKVEEEIQDLPESKTTKTREELDDLLDEIDLILEHESFAIAYVQKGGE